MQEWLASPLPVYYEHPYTARDDRENEGFRVLLERRFPPERVVPYLARAINQNVRYRSRMRAR